MLYRKTSAREGELRFKSWNAMFEPPTGPDDVKWAARAKQYWELQERLYGLRLSDFALLVDEVDTTVGRAPVVTTVVTVLEVLPGERTSDYSRVTAAMVAGRQ